MKTVNNILHEATERKTRGKKPRSLCDDEVRARCERILDFCKTSKEEGGYDCATSRGRMVNKVKKILDDLANHEALTCNSEMEDIHTKQDHLINTMQGLINAFKNNNDEAGVVCETQKLGILSHQKVQTCLTQNIEENIKTIQLEEASSSGLKQKYMEVQKKYKQAAADRDTWHEVAQSSQGATDPLEGMMGDQLVNTLTEQQEEIGALKDKVACLESAASSSQDALLNDDALARMLLKRREHVRARIEEVQEAKRFKDAEKDDA